MITTDYFRQKLNKKGMTLVEVIVAVVIVAISALLLLTSFSASLNLVNHGDKMNTLANEAFAQVEQLAAEDYNNSLTFHLRRGLLSWKSHTKKKRICYDLIMAIYRIYGKRWMYK